MQQLSWVRLPLALCMASALIVGVRYPAWSAVLQSGSYGYSTYSDLAVNLAKAPNTVIAGAATAFGVRIGNAGPDAAAGVELLAMGQDGLTLYASSGCAASRDSHLLCELTEPLASGGDTEVIVNGQISPDARGVVSFGGAVGARSNDEQLGNNSFAAVVPVSVRVDLRLSVASSSPTAFIDPGTGNPRLRWQVGIDNNGPSTARQISYLLDRIQASGPVAVACTGLQGGVCPPAVAAPLGVLRPGARLQLTVITPTLQPDEAQLEVQISAVSQEASNDGPLPNTVTLVYANALFSNGME